MNTTSSTSRDTAEISSGLPIRELFAGTNYIKEIQRLIRQDVARQQRGIVPATSNISELVANERISSKYWKYVEALALTVNPRQYRERVAFLTKARSAHSLEAA